MRRITQNLMGEKGTGNPLSSDDVRRDALNDAIRQISLDLELGVKEITATYAGPFNLPPDFVSIISLNVHQHQLTQLTEEELIGHDPSYGDTIYRSFGWPRFFVLRETPVPSLVIWPYPDGSYWPRWDGGDGIIRNSRYTLRYVPEPVPLVNDADRPFGGNHPELTEAVLYQATADLFEDKGPQFYGAAGYWRNKADQKINDFKAHRNRNRPRRISLRLASVQGEPQ